MPSTASFLMLSATMFAVGLVGVIIRRNMITVLMCIELMLNAVNINLVAFWHYLTPQLTSGQMFTIIVLTVAAAEAAVGLAIIIALHRHKDTLNVDAFRLLRW